MTYKIKITCLKCSLLLLFLQIWLLLGAQNKFAPIDAWLHQNIQGLGGRAVLVLYQDGKMVYAKAVNQLSRRQQLVSKLIARKRGIDKDEALQDFGLQTRQRIASCSKWLSAALVMSFVDEGQLLLTDTIGRFLPLLSAKGKGRITIAHCLSHLTGIQAPPLKESIGEMGKVPDMDSAVRMIADMPIEGAPGKVFNYSNSGLQLAAAVIEKISGKDFETLFQERIAVPCGMTNTDFGHGPVPLAAGGAFSTPIDYLQFLEMILHDGLYRGKRVLSAQSVAAMQRNYTAGAAVAHTPAEAANWGYGLGHWVMEEAEPRSRAVTSPGLFGSFPWVDNQLGYAGFLFTMNLHSKGRNERYRALKRLVDEALR